MHLTVEHETVFRFDELALHSIQYLRLTPRPDQCQRIISWALDTEGSLKGWSDGFDNPTHVSVQDGDHDRVVVHATGEVQTFDTNGILPLDDGIPPLIFLRTTTMTRAGEHVGAFVKPFEDAVSDGDRLSLLHALMEAVADKVTYEPGMTTVETQAEEALEHGNGVCQDQAHVFIAACRYLGIPARYVSGYILAGVGNDSHIASHAWAEALVEGLGWVSFDAANRQCATDAYIRLAIGLDYASACPVRGLRKGGGMEEMNVKVSVEQ